MWESARFLENGPIFLIFGTKKLQINDLAAKLIQFPVILSKKKVGK